METNNKYYTPDESEYHIGFEYQSLTDPRQPEKDIAWSNESINNIQELRDVCKYIIEDDFLEHRVKYLDKEDIESFGFKLEENDEYRYKEKECVLYLFYDNTISIDVRLNGILNKEIVGLEIKNKSELSFILKRLGIID